MYKELLDQIIIAVLIPVIPLLGYYLKLWVSQQIETLREKQNIDRVNFYLDRVESLIYEVVRTVSQTYVEDLKASGSFTVEAQREALNKAKNMVLELTKEEGQLIIEELYGDFNSYIEIQIERIVNELKG